MKNIAVAIITIALIILAVATSSLFAEYRIPERRFHRRGSGHSRDIDTLTITTPNRLKTEIPQTEILRVLKNNDYKKPSTIRRRTDPKYRDTWLKSERMLLSSG